MGGGWKCAGVPASEGSLTGVRAPPPLFFSLLEVVHAPSRVQGIVPATGKLELWRVTFQEAGVSPLRQLSISANGERR